MNSSQLHFSYLDLMQLEGGCNLDFFLGNGPAHHRFSALDKNHRRAGCSSAGSACANERLVLVKKKYAARIGPRDRRTMKNTQRSYHNPVALCPGQNGNPRDFVPVTFEIPEMIGVSQ
jgi:hypothetical protein